MELGVHFLLLLLLLLSLLFFFFFLFFLFSFLQVDGVGTKCYAKAKSEWKSKEWRSRKKSHIKFEIDLYHSRGIIFKCHVSNHIRFTVYSLQTLSPCLNNFSSHQDGPDSWAYDVKSSLCIALVSSISLIQYNRL